MKANNINVILMLTSGIIVGIIGVYFSYPLEKLAYTLLIVLVIFYILGTFLGTMFQNVVAQGVANQMEQRLDKKIGENDDETIGIDEQIEVDTQTYGEDKVVARDIE